MRKKQKQALDIINRYYSKHEIFPTLEQIGQKMGIGRSTVHKHVSILIKEGYLLEGEGKSAYKLAKFKGRWKSRDDLSIELEVANERIKNLKKVITDTKKVLKTAYGL